MAAVFDYILPKESDTTERLNWFAKLGKHHCKGSLRCQTYFSLPSRLSLSPPDGQGQLYLPKWWLFSLSGDLVEGESWVKEVAAIAWNVMRSSECPLVEVFTIWKPGLISNLGNSVSGKIRKNSSSGFLEVSINGTICIFMFLFLYPCILP